MSDWNDSSEQLPPIDEIVEVWMNFGQGGTTRLKGYRLTGRSGGEPLWLNALTHEPFPEGWQVVRWRHAGGDTVQHAVLSGDDAEH